MISLKKISDHLNDCLRKKSILDLILQSDFVSMHFCPNLINFLKVSIENIRIDKENDYSIIINESASFQNLCFKEFTEVLEYMLWNNKSSLIKHDFNRYLDIAIAKNNQELALKLVEFQLTKNLGDTLSELHWKEINKRQWWNVIARILDKCKEDIKEFNFSPLEFTKKIEPDRRKASLRRDASLESFRQINSSKLSI